MIDASHNEDAVAADATAAGDVASGEGGSGRCATRVTEVTPPDVTAADAAATPPPLQSSLVSSAGSGKYVGIGGGSSAPAGGAAAAASPPPPPPHPLKAHAARRSTSAELEALAAQRVRESLAAESADAAEDHLAAQDHWRLLIRERVEVKAAKKKQTSFLYLGVAALVVGAALAGVGLSLGWERGTRFPIVIGGYCAALATLLSLLQILEHLSAFCDPDIQSRIVRILCMVPIYAVSSWLAIVFTDQAVYFDLVRDMYESYAIYTFFSLMLGFLGGLDECVRHCMIEGHSGSGFQHPWPLCCLRRWYMLPQVLYRITLGILQFMLLKPLCTVVVVVLTATDSYGSSFTDLSKGFVYMTIVYNISITFAFTALIYFYIGARDQLREHDPLLKFACIKGVIFLSYWQSLIIAVMDAAGWLPPISFWEKGDENERREKTRAGLQDFLICCEMLLFAVAHKFVFGAREYSRGLQVGARIVRGSVLPTARQGIWTNLKRTARHEDIKNDLFALWSFIRAF
eukprot:Rhum_TRINITY_DN14924_c26_g1::Rhum_TRINITY_DN14924_c26_g1_i1::g.129195::m.129195